MKKTAYKLIAGALIIGVLWIFVIPAIFGGNNNSGSSQPSTSSSGDVSLEEENAQLRARVAELEAQVKALQNEGSVPDQTLKEFLDAYFVPDGYKHRLTADVHLFATPDCTGEEISSEGLVFLQDECLPLPKRPNGSTPYMVYDQNGTCFYTLNNVYYETIYEWSPQNPCIPKGIQGLVVLYA